ncbi:MAG: MFS transporter, partial [Promethearchaeota archaeon]
MRRLIIEKTRTWKFWPVMCLSFLYPVNTSLISLSIPIYYFNIGVSVEIIGFLAAASSITYSFSPVLVDKLSQKLGRKKSILIATLGASAAQISFYFTLEPVIFFIARLMEGFVMGFFWPNLQSTIS